jgi:ABC-type transport system substrate-binding protein
MNARKTWTRALVTASVALLLLLVCRSPAAAQPAAKQPGARPAVSKELVWSDGSDIVTLDGAFVTDVVTNTLTDLIFDHLVRYRADMSTEPDLAESWSVGNNNLSWTFKLRKGVKFSSGNPVDAEAVKFSLDRIMDEKTGAANRSVYAAVSRIEVADPSTVRITTKSPFPDLLTALADRAGAIMDPAEVKKYANPKEVGLHPVGSGPYRLAEWEPGVKIVLKRNPQYTGKRTALDTITYRPVPEAGTRMAMLKAGDADLITKPVLDELPTIEKDPNLKLLKKPGFNLIMYEMLTDKKPLDDVRVRRAMNHAVDRKALAEKLLNGLATPASSTVSPGVGPSFYFPQPALEYSPDKARRLLKEAGYPNGFDIEMWSSNGRYLKDREVSETVQAYLAAVGIRAKLQTFEWATYQAKWHAPDRTMWLIGRSAGNTDYMFTRLFSKAEWDKGANNNTRFYDPTVEDLLVKARSTFDVKERAAFYKQIQERTWAFMPALYLYTQTIVVAQRAHISGLEVMGNEVLVLRGVDKN